MSEDTLSPERCLARALIAFVNEHGLPNAVSPGELAAYHSNLRPQEIGRLLRWRRAEIDARLTERGISIDRYFKDGSRGMRIELEKL